MSPKQFPPLFALCIGTFIAVLILGGLGLSQLQIQQQQAQDRYGNSQVVNLSQQAQEAALKRDLISLRVIAEQALQSPGIDSVSVFGIDNKLLATAGEPHNRHQAASLSYSHAINIEDSVVGYITIAVTAKASGSGFQYTFWVLLILSLAGAALSWLGHPSTAQQDKTSNSAAPTKASSEYAETPDIGAWLIIQSGNLGRLQQQLSATALEQLLSEFNRQLESVLNLYQGQLLWVDGDSFHCGFHINSKRSACAVSNAICSSKLLLELGRKRPGIKLHFKAAILPPAAGREYSHLFAAYKASHKQRLLLQDQADGTVLISQSLLQQSNMREQLELSSTHLPDTQIIDQIKPAYSKLLDEQLKTLAP